MIIYWNVYYIMLNKLLKLILPDFLKRESITHFKIMYLTHVFLLGSGVLD